MVRKSIVKMSIGAIIAASILIMVSCNGGDEGQAVNNEAPAAKENVLRWGTTSAPSGNFNPNLTTDSYNFIVSNVIYETLLELNPSADFEALLAKSWTVSDDQKTVTFNLRNDVTWHDGEAFNAEDVKFTLEFVASKGFAGAVSGAVKPIKGYEAFHNGETAELAGVKIVDPYTIAVTTEDIYAPVLSALGDSVKILPEHIWSAVKPEEAGEATALLRNPVGTGPFKFGEFVADQYTTIVRNENYWGSTAKLDKIIFQVINVDTVLAKLINGEIDYVSLYSLDPDDVKAYKENGLKFYTAPETAHQMLVVNNQNEILNNKYVRQAFTYAIDRKGIVENIVHGYGRVGNQIYPQDFWLYPGDDAINHYEYNPDKAIELLTTKAGWVQKDGKLYINGEPAKFTLIYPMGNKARELSAPVIQENFKDIGIELDIQLMEFKTMLGKLYEEGSDAFDLSLLGLGIDTHGDVTRNIHTNAMFKEGYNFARYSNPELDKLLDAGIKTLDRNKRIAIYKKVAKIINEEMPYVYLYNWSQGIVTSPKLRGMVLNNYDYEYKIENWTMQ